MGSMLIALRSTLSTAAVATATAVAAGLPTCAGCGRPAGGDGCPMLQAQGKSFHPACFVCAGGHKPLVDPTGGGGGLQFNLGEDGQAYHPVCHKEPRRSVCADFIPQLGHHISGVRRPALPGPMAAHCKRQARAARQWGAWCRRAGARPSVAAWLCTRLCPGPLRPAGRAWVRCLCESVGAERASMSAGR
jgi:hypothetical protein